MTVTRDHVFRQGNISDICGYHSPGEQDTCGLLRQRHQPPEWLVHEVTPRGFSHLPAIPSTHGGEITAYESSSAMQASIWVKVYEKMPGSEERTAVVHLTVEDAAKLRDQLDWLIENHYQFR